MATNPTTRSPRIVTARRVLMAGAAVAALGGAAHAGGPAPHDAAAKVWLASGTEATTHSTHSASGGGEGEGAEHIADEADFLAAIGFMEGHIRAGMKLYETGDLAAAKTHMGHPIAEKYEAVEHELKERGHGDLEAKITTLAKATENEASKADIEALYEDVLTEFAAVKATSPGGAPKRLLALARLTRIAANEYTAAIKDSTVSDLHEYQDSWGFLRAVEAEAKSVAATGDDEAQAAALAILTELATTDAAYGDIQGKGAQNLSPKLLHAAAARMELSALSVD